jgi:hypothetical protein
MTRKLLAVLVACSVAGCAASPTTGVATAAEKPDGCTQAAGVRGIKIVYNSNGEPIDVAVDFRPNDLPVGNARELRVKECENVRINTKRGSAGRSGMVIFDKDAAFRSPGRRPAYLSRRNFVFIPIDDRDVTGVEEFSYSVHVDCPEASSPCKPLDPKIVVER